MITNVKLAGITKFKYERKNEKDCGRSSEMTPTCKWPIIGKQAPGNHCKKRNHFKRRLEMTVRISAEMNRIVGENDVRFDNLCGIYYLTNVFTLYFLRQCFSIRPATLTIE